MNYPTTAQQIERLEQGLRVLNEMPPHERRKHFYMTLWGLKTECGTVGCFAGHCGLDPWFRRRGFKMVPALYASDAWSVSLCFPNVRPMAFFGTNIVERIFSRTDLNYGEVKRLVKKVIKELKEIA